MGQNDLEKAVGGVVGAVIILTIAALVALAVLTWATFVEVAKIFASRAVGRNTPAAKLLWASLAGFLALLLICGLLGTDPRFTAPATVTAGWAFFVFTLIVVFTELHERHADQERLAAALQNEQVTSIEDVLTPWRFDQEVATGNIV